MIHHSWLSGSKWPSPLPPKKKLSLEEIWNFPSSWLQDAKKPFSPKKIFGIRIIFFVWDLYSLFYTWSFQATPAKNHPHLKCQSSPKISIWPMSLLYKPSEKWFKPPSKKRSRGGGCKLWIIYKTSHPV